MPSVPRMVTLPAALELFLEIGLLEEPARDHRRQALAQADVGEQLLARARAAVAHHALPGRVVDLGERALQRLAAPGRAGARPGPADSSYCMVFRKWRMLERALPVRTYCSQPGLGLAWLAVMISTRSPLRSSVRSGTSSPFTLAATQRLPMSVCTRVGEVDRGRAARQRQDPALGREHVDLVGEQVHLDVLEELLRVARLVLDLEQRLQPAVGLLLQLGELVGVVLVHPVRGDARLGEAVHLLGADLHLDRHAVGADEVGVDRLVAVRLRDRDVVLELARDRLVERVQRAEREVAGRHVLHDHAAAEDVVHLGERAGASRSSCGRSSTRASRGPEHGRLRCRCRRASS